MENESLSFGLVTQNQEQGVAPSSRDVQVASSRHPTRNIMDSLAVLRQT